MELQASNPRDRSLMATTEPKALACLLEYRTGSFVALPVHTSVELVEGPTIVPVPGMPAFALGLMYWQGRYVPLIDVTAYLRSEHGDHAEPVGDNGHVLVVAYQASAGEPLEYAALRAPFLVRMTEVSNSQSCLLPPHLTGRKRFMLACFKYQGQAVPVLDLARIFASAKPSIAVSEAVEVAPIL